MKYAPLLLVCLLAACGQPNGSANGSAAADAAAPVAGSATTTVAPSAAALPLQPGKWESTVTITDLQMTGLPPGMKTPKPAPVTKTSCLTPEDAGKGPARMLKALQDKFGDKCTIGTADYAGGQLKQSITCNMPSGALTVSTTGTYSSTSVTTDAEASLTGKMSMTEKVHSEARRVGACD